MKGKVYKRFDIAIGVGQAPVRLSGEITFNEQENVAAGSVPALSFRVTVNGNDPAAGGVPVTTPALETESQEAPTMEYR